MASSSAGVHIGTVACLDKIIQALHDGSAIVDKLAQRNYERGQSSPSASLENSLDNARKEIEQERASGVAGFGKLFEDGDHIAVIALQQIVIEVQSSFLENLRDATCNPSQATVDFTGLLDAAELSRDRTITALREFHQRLQQQMGQSTSGVSTPVPTPNPAPLGPVETNSRRTSADAPLTPQQLSKQQPGPKSRTLNPANGSRDAPGGEEDAASGTDDVMVPGRKRHSLLQFLKNHRVPSTGEVKQTPPAVLHSQHSLHPAQPPVEENRPSPTPSNVPFRPPPQCDASSFTPTPDPATPNPISIPATPAVNPTDDELPADYKATLERREFTALYHDASPPLRPASPILSTRKNSSPHGSASVITPTPENDYLGFCKSAWKLQNGDRRGSMQKAKETEPWSRHPSSHASAAHFLACTHHKCAFRSSFSNPSVDYIWDKVFTVESKGLKFRWPFLAKSHILQRVVVKYQYAFQCLFCVLLGTAKGKIYHGTEAYLDHISTEHRGQTFGDVILYKTRCVSDRVAAESDDFDINLFPLNFEQTRDTRSLSFSDDFIGDSLANADANDSMLALNEPWNEGLSEFHYGGELDPTELA